jgi:hypothetical protein
MLAGAKADVDATKREVRKSFIVICLCVVCLAVMFIGVRFYEEEGMSSLWNEDVMGKIKTNKSPLLMARTAVYAWDSWPRCHLAFRSDLHLLPPHITHHRPHRSTK